MGRMNANSALHFLPLPFVLLTMPIMVRQLEATDVWPQFRGPDGQGHATVANP